MFGFGLLYHYSYLIKFLSDYRAKGSELSNGICSKCCSGEVCALKPVSCKSEPLKSLENTDGFLFTKILKAEDAIEGNDDNDSESDDESVISCKEDEVFDVLLLRKLVKIERRRGNKARAELEKERMDAASAAEEAMAMILRLQNEKSSSEIQANHYRQIAEQKRQYDESVIQSLQWIIMKHESERSVLEEQLRLCRQKCNGQSEEGDPNTNLFGSTIMENDGLKYAFGANYRYFESD